MTTRTTEEAQTPSRAKLLDLSLTQLLGGSMAAATAAALGSRLGVMGTIIGAAVGSVVTAVAASLYTNSMSRAREAIVAARSYGRGLADAPRADWWRGPDRAATRRMLATTAAVFAIAAAFLTGLQLATGAPVTGTTIGTRSAAVGQSGSAGGDGQDAPAGSSGATQTSTPSSPVTGTPSPVTPSVDSSGAAGEEPTAPSESVGATTPGQPAPNTPSSSPAASSDPSSGQTSPLPATP
jgi:hypothetical protein